MKNRRLRLFGVGPWSLLRPPGVAQGVESMFSILNPPQFLRQVCGSLPSHLGTLLQAPPDNVFERLGQRSVAEGGFAAQDGGDDLRLVHALKCSPAGRDFEEDSPEREEVGPGVYGLPLNLLRSHVLQCPNNRAYTCDRGLRGETALAGQVLAAPSTSPGRNPVTSRPTA
jgi:hypothetical protein